LIVAPEELDTVADKILRATIFKFNTSNKDLNKRLNFAPFQRIGPGTVEDGIRQMCENIEKANFFFLDLQFL
jgi:hypothetical protein